MLEARLLDRSGQLIQRGQGINSEPNLCIQHYASPKVVLSRLIKARSRSSINRCTSRNVSPLAKFCVCDILAPAAAAGWAVLVIDLAIAAGSTVRANSF